MTHAKAKEFFENFIGESCLTFYPLPQSGSARRNFVGTTRNQKYIITYNENIRENQSFFYFSQVFSNLSINAPEILYVSEDEKLYVQESVGNETLSEIIANEGLTGRVKTLVKKTLRELAGAQLKTFDCIDYSKTFEYEKYDELPVTSDLYYFKNFIADVLELPYHKQSLLSDFKKLTDLIASLQPAGLMMRDFQARNIMVNEEDEIYFIDYQSAMRGPLMYDVISFLYQAKANFPKEFKKEMMAYYLSHWNTDSAAQLSGSVEYIQLIRYLQVLGAYGFRGLIQRKKHFLESLEKGIQNIFEFSKEWEGITDFPELAKLIMTLHSSLGQNRIENIINTKKEIQ